MYMTQDEARSDFVLAAAPAVVYELVALELLPRMLGSLAANRFLQAGLLFAFTGLVPLWLARYRGQGLAAFGLDADREGLRAGLPMAAVFLLASVLYGLPDGVSVIDGAKGIFVAIGASPTVGGSGTDLVGAFGLVALVAARAIGSVLLLTFLTTRARTAFREVDMSRVEALRTYGMAMGAGLLLLGLLLSLGNDPLFVLLPGFAIVVLVLLADRLVAPGATSSRWAMVAPGLVLVFVQSGLFGLLRDPLGTLFAGAITFAIALIGSVLVETRRYAWAAVPLVVANAVWVLNRLTF